MKIFPFFVMESFIAEKKQDESPVPKGCKSGKSCAFSRSKPTFSSDKFCFLGVCKCPSAEKTGGHRPPITPPHRVSADSAPQAKNASCENSLRFKL